MISKVDSKVNVNEYGKIKIKFEKTAEEMPNCVLSVKTYTKNNELVPLITPFGQNLEHNDLVRVANDLIAKADKSDPDWRNKLIMQVESLNYCLTTRINIQNEIRKYSEEK